MTNKVGKSLVAIVVTVVLCGLLVFLFFSQPYNGEWRKVKLLSTDIDTYQEEQIGGELNFQCYTNGDVVYEAWLAVVNAFEKASGVKVNLMAGTEVNTKRQTDWQNGNPPDIVSNTGTGFSGLMQIESSSLADLSEFFNTARIWGSETLIKDKLSTNGEDSYKELLEFYGDDVYLAPYMTSTYGMYYNDTFYQENGWTFPTNYDELLNFASTSYEQTGKAAISFPGTSAGYLVWGFLMPAVAAEAKAQNNMQYFTDLCAGKEYCFDMSNESSSILKSVLEKYYAFTHANGGTGVADCLSKNHTTTQSELYTNQNLSLANGQWLYSELYSTLKDDKTGFKLNYASSPLVDSTQDSTVVLLPVTMAIAEKAKNRPQAEAFLRFLYRDDIQHVLTAAYGYQSIFEDFDYSKNSEDYSYSAQQIYSVLEDCNKVYIRYSWGSLGELMNAKMVSLCPDASSPESVDKAMQDLFTQSKTFIAYMQRLGREL